MLDMFFSSGIARPALLWQQHDPRLVALSVLLAILASMMALHMAALARRASGALPRHLALLTGAIALGGGIWAMHFIGMLAFALCARGRFDPWMTLVSFVPGLAASWVALHLLMRRTVGPWVLLGGGVLVGGGIGAMHYIGMAASELAPMMRYDPVGFATSIVVAVLLATLALWVRFGLQRHMRWRHGRIHRPYGISSFCRCSRPWKDGREGEGNLPDRFPLRRFRQDRYPGALE